MLVQIYSLTTAEDVRAMVDLGVDHLGFAAGEDGVPAGISLDQARDLFELVPDDHRTVALTVKTDVDAVVEKGETLRPDVMHLCPEPGALSPADVGDVADRVPADVEVMTAVAVNGRESVDRAREFDSPSDYLILDTAAPDVPGIGASGETHDWSISREIVRSTDAPVILAGGLSPENVAEAVREVRPAGVDSYTRTSRTERRKDVDAVETFVERARQAASGDDG